MTDRLLEIVRSVEPRFALSYRKHYIGLACDGVADNIVTFRPRKSHVVTEFRIARSDALTARLEEAGLTLLEYSTRWGRYRLQLTAEDITKHQELLKELVVLAGSGEPASPG